MLLPHLPRILLLSALLAGHVFAQTLASTPYKSDDIPPAAANQPIDAETQKAAWALLGSVISDSDGFRLPDNRLVIKRITAMLLWPKDPDRARALYREAAAAWLQWADRLDPEDLPSGSLRYQFMQAREQLLSQLSTQDAALAFELMRQTRAALPTNLLVALDYKDSSERNLEIMLVSRLTAQNPAETLKLAREHLARYGVSPALVDLVKTLKERDRAKAAELGGAIVSKLQGEDLRDKSELRQAALELWQVALPLAPPANSNDKPAAQIELLLEQSDFRSLSDLLAACIEKRPGANSNAEEVFSALQSNIATLEKHASGAAAKVRREMRRQAREARAEAANATALATPATAEPVDEMQKYIGDIEKAPLGDALDIIRKAPEETRESLYYQLGSKIEEAGDPEEARRLLLEKMPNVQFRQNLLAQLDNKTLLSTAAKGDVEKLRAQLIGIKNPNKRVLAMIQASAAIAQKDRAIALKLLDEAAPLVNQPARTVTQLGTQAMLLNAYAAIEPKKAFAILETMAGRLDELIPSAIALAEFVGEDEMVENDELHMGMLSLMLGGERLLPAELMATPKILARADFARLRNLAERFQRPEARTLARLIVVMSALEESNATSATPAQP